MKIPAFIKIIIFNTVCRSFLLLSTFPVFSFLPRVFPMPLYNFAHYNVVLNNAPLSDRDKRKKKKKRDCNGLLFSGNLDTSSLTPGGSVVTLVCDFRRR